jgi:hypothetical protein
MAEGTQRQPRDLVMTLRETVKFLNWAMTAYSYDQDRVVALDDAMQDILHEIELGESKRTPEAARLYKEMRSIRRERRACKDEMEQLKPLVDWCIGNKGVIHNFERIQGVIGSIRERQGNRQYRLRSPEREAWAAIDRKEAAQ